MSEQKRGKALLSLMNKLISDQGDTYANFGEFAEDVTVGSKFEFKHSSGAAYQCWLQVNMRGFADDDNPAAEGEGA